MKERMGNGSTEGPIKVLLADDHTLFREGIAELLISYGDMEVVGQTTNDAGAIGLSRQLKPDVVLMQVQIPLLRAKRAVSEMLALRPQPKVVIVTMFEDPRYVRELMHLGISAYLIKSVSVEHLLGTIRAAVFDPNGQHVVVGLPQEALEEAKGGAKGVLTAREMEILLLAARGLHNRQIAASLRLSEATVKRHLANTYEKMEVSSRGEATKKALFEEWITIRDVTQDAAR